MKDLRWRSSGMGVITWRHHGRPGAVRALGGLLGREDINISRKRVGVHGESAMAIALISISAPLSAKAMAEIRELPPIQQAVEFEL
jgi:hypothetical protein